MPIPITIPKATITMEEAAVQGWRKQAGEWIEKGEILFEMETDKVIVEVPAPASGVLLRIDVEAGSARVEQAIGWIGEPGEVVPDPGLENDAPATEQTAAPVAVAGLPPRAREGVATPAARRRARELGVNLSQVQGTGPGGRITEADVEEAGQRP